MIPTKFGVFGDSCCLFLHPKDLLHGAQWSDLLGSWKNCCLDSQIGSNWRVFAVQQKMEHVKNTKNSCAACGIDLFLGCPESLSNLLQNSPPHVENRPRPNLEVCLTNGSIVPSLGSTKKEGRVFQQIYDVFAIGFLFPLLGSDSVALESGGVEGSKGATTSPKTPENHSPSLGTIHCRAPELQLMDPRTHPNALSFRDLR